MRLQVPRLVRMHSDELEDIQEASAGDIVALFGVECASGDTFCDANTRCVCVWGGAVAVPSTSAVQCGAAQCGAVQCGVQCGAA